MDRKIAQIYKGKHEELNIQFTRVWSMPSHQTFTIQPIKNLLDRYVGDGKGWVDPFAGNNSPAEITNDHNPEIEATYNLDVMDFVEKLTRTYRGILFDPPYSFTQIAQHYKTVIGRRASKYETSMSFYEKPKSALCEKIRVGGYVISFGWNTNGFGKARGFKIVEIMAVAHGGSKNDTFVTVEKKLTPNKDKKR